MLRTRPASRFACVTCVTLAALLATPALADDVPREARLAEILLDHGVPEATIWLAEHAPLASRPESAKLKARALALQAAIEKDAKTAPRPRFLQAWEELDLAWELRGLGRLGWAEAALDAALSGEVFSGKDLSAARTIRARLWGDRSCLGNGDSKKRKECYEKAREILAGIYDKPGISAAEAADARATLYEIETSRGDALLEASKAGFDPEPLRQEASLAYEEGAKVLEAERKRLDAIADRSPEDERCFAAASFGFPRCMLGEALSLASTEREKREPLLKRVVDLLEEFNLTFSDPASPSLLAYEAAIDMGRAHRALGNDAAALAALDSALAIEKTSPDFDPYSPDKKKPLALDDASLDVFARATIEKARYLASKGKRRDAAALVERAFVDAAAPPYGRKAYRESPTGKALRATLERESDDATAESECKLMEAAHAERAFGPALRHGERALALLPALAAESREAMRARVLHGIGRAHAGLSRHYEASVAFEEVARRHASSPQAEEAALEWLASLEKIASLSSGAGDREVYERALRFVGETRRGTGEAVAAFFLGNELRDEGRYDAAAEAFDKVPADTRMHGEALFESGRCRYLHALRGKLAKEAARDALLAAKSRLRAALDLSLSRRDSTTNLEGRARFLLAEVLLTDGVDEPREVLALFDPIRSRGAHAGDRARATLFRILARLRLGEPESAEKELEALLADDATRTQARTILAARKVAFALDEATSARADLSPDERRKVRARIGRYYERGVLAGFEPGSEAVPSAAETRRAAARLLALGLDQASLAEDSQLSDEDGEADASAGRALLLSARDLYALLARPDERLSGKDAGERWRVLAGWGEAAGFAGDWTTCRSALERLVAETKLLDATGGIDAGVAARNDALVPLYLDLGRACVETGLAGHDGASVDAGVRVFENVLRVVGSESAFWWKAKLAVYRALERRGEASDYRQLATAMRASLRKYPDFEAAGKIGGKFRELAKRLREKGFTLD